jgi:hypothetical protein
MDSMWKDIATWMWALLLMPVSSLWKKMESAVTKAELADVIKALNERTEVIRNNTKELFDNAEHDRRCSEKKFSEMQQTIHGIHVDLLQRMSENGLHAERKGK